MFDKITIRAKLTDEQIFFLKQCHRLCVWYNSDRTQVEYRSSEFSNFSGIEIFIKQNVLTLKTSLHKYWFMRCSGTKRNDNLFTISEAKLAFESLLYENKLQPEKVKIVYFEIGLNLEVSYDPITFIRNVIRIPGSNDKLMFVDANYNINRQRTTEKHKDIRKYYKIYDKSWEMMKKSRLKEKPTNSTNILRIETCCRRHSEVAVHFFTDTNLEKLIGRFYSDWNNLVFYQEIQGKKGVRFSEIKKARMLIDEGLESYLAKSKKELKKRSITDTQYRTMREYARDFEKKRTNFLIKKSVQEIEYKSLITKVFNNART